MSESAYTVGYGRPPEHTRFQKGQSGNPGGKSKPKKSIKRDFDAALRDALKAEEQALRTSKPTKVIEAIARQIALLALDGPPSTQRFVVSILDREGGDAADGERR